MNSNILKDCKTKGCNNPVLKGKYCEHCSQIKKEKRNKVIKGAGSVLGFIVVTGLSALIKKPRK